MIVTDRFVFLHMPKTGGSFVESILTRLRDAGVLAFGHEGRWLSRNRHSTYRHIPPAYRSMWKLVCIRPLADHYVSQFAFGWWHGCPIDFFNNENALRQLPPETTTFAQFMRACNDPEINHWRREFDPFAARYGYVSNEWARFLHDDPAEFLRIAMRDALEATEYLAGQRIFVARQERLNLDLFRFLCLAGLPPERVSFVLNEGRILPTDAFQAQRDRDWRTYLTDEDRAYLLEMEEPALRLAPDYRVGLQF